jgi:hypothetical protein
LKNSSCFTTLQQFAASLINISSCCKQLCACIEIPLPTQALLKYNSMTMTAITNTAKLWGGTMLNQSWLNICLWTSYELCLRTQYRGLWQPHCQALCQANTFQGTTHSFEA